MSPTCNRACAPRVCQRRSCSGSVSAGSGATYHLLEIWRANTKRAFYSGSMHEQPQIEIPGEPQPDRRPLSFAMLVATAAVVIVLAGFFFLPGRASPSHRVPEVPPPFRPPERPYTPQTKSQYLALSRATNFLNQGATPLTRPL